MREPELMFCEDGTILSWTAQDGMLLVGISDENESHEHRLVLAPEDLAPMLRDALLTGLLVFGAGPRPEYEGVLFNVLEAYIDGVDAQRLAPR